MTIGTRESERQPSKPLGFHTTLTLENAFRPLLGLSETQVVTKDGQLVAWQTF